MVNEFKSFSPCGRRFVSLGADGKLKLWDTLSGILKQEFLPFLHLNQPCTSFLWLRLFKSAPLEFKTKKKKRRSLSSSEALCLGTNTGKVAVYNISEGKITCTLDGGHTAPVSCLAWNKTNDLFSASENNIVVWNLTKKTIKTKWKCDRGKITCMGVSEDGNICITGCFKLKMWSVPSKSLIKVLTGHSDVVKSIQFLPSSNLFLSTAANDRSISVWSTEEGAEEAVGRLVLENSVEGEVSCLVCDGVVRVAAVCSSGILHCFKHQFNGSRSKPVKPVHRVQIASGAPPHLENGTSTPSPQVCRIPVVAVHCISTTTATITYGHHPAFTFENIELKEDNETSYLIRNIAASKAVEDPTSKSVVGMELDEAEYLGGGVVGGGVVVTGGGGRKGKEVPLEERLNNLSTLDPTASSAPASDASTPHSMAQLLSQALHSKDKALLETVLFRKELSVVKQTLSRLPVNLVPSLVKELATMIQGKALTSSIGAVWLRSLLSLHSSQLLGDEHSLSTLSALHALVETRLSSLPRLLRLSGRLDLLLQQLQGQSTSLDTDQPALLVYQDEESSEEGSSVGGDGGENPSESEDKWDELSDLDTEEMST